MATRNWRAAKLDSYAPAVLLWILLLALLPASAAAADAGSEAPDCEEEGPLSEAAAELLLRGIAPSSQELTRAVRAAGSDLMGVRAYYARAEAGDPQRWLTAFKHGADAAVVCGLARSERGQLWLVGARAGTLEPFVGGRAVVRGSVSAAFEDPQIVVEDAAGEFARVAIDRKQLARGVPLSDALQRPLRVQLLARGPSGPRPLAERVLTEGRPPAEPAHAEEEVDDAASDTPVVARLAELRRAQGRLPLRDNQLLAQVADAHAQHVCEAGKIAHELEAGSDPQQRLSVAGIRARRVGETVARARSAAAAFAAFESSPSHRLTLLEPDFTDAGVGEASDARGRRCVVVLLAAWPRYVGR